jgi:hypothetical protein
MTTTGVAETFARVWGMSRDEIDLLLEGREILTEDQLKRLGAYIAECLKDQTKSRKKLLCRQFCRMNKSRS